MKKVLSQYTFYVFLLPLFFVLHGYTENFDLVPVIPALRLFGIYLLVAEGFVLLFYLLYRNNRKASLVSFFILAYYFFFGTVQDTLSDIAPGTFFSRYVFILPLSLLCFTILLIVLKRSSKPLLRTTLYLNSLLLLLVVMDSIILVSKVIGKNQNNIIAADNLNRCIDCPNPDIYFILADGYPGKLQARDILNYDNSNFEAELKKRGFHITDSSLANYNYTFFSLASMLNMNYLKNVHGSVLNKKNIPSASKAMKHNQVLKFLLQQGYQFYNYSIFDINNKKTITRPTFWIRDTRPITRQTFLYRLNRDLGYHLVTTLKVKPVNAYPIEQDLDNNELVYSRTLKTARDTTHSKFVYTHLVMPHHPYYFDSLGNKTPVSDLTQLHGFDKAAAISYLVYSNKRFLTLIDSIQTHSVQPPIILLASDHGFREITADKDKKTMFLNLNAVFFPNKDYRYFYKGMSNVNVFRVLLKTQFKQELKLLQDSTVYLKD